jgi:hypothetical protein
VSVLLGNGNGTFQAARNLFTGPLPTAVAVADLNGDGLPDFVVTSALNIYSNVGVLLGQRNAATHFLISAPASVKAGVPFTVTLNALTAGGQVDDQYVGTVHFTSSDGAAVLPTPDYTFTKGDLGVHTFTVTLNTAGSQTVTAADTKQKSITGTATVTVNSPAPAAPPPSGSSGTASAAGATASGLSESGDRTRAEGLAAWLAEDAHAGNDPIRRPFSPGPAPESLRDVRTDGARTNLARATGTALAPPSAPVRRGLPASSRGAFDPALVDAFFTGGAPF